MSRTKLRSRREVLERVRALSEPLRVALSTLPDGKATPQGPLALPKQQPAAKQPRRPMACPSAIPGAKTSPSTQNDQRSRRAKLAATTSAAATPP